MTARFLSIVLAASMLAGCESGNGNGGGSSPKSDPVSQAVQGDCELLDSEIMLVLDTSARMDLPATSGLPMPGDGHCPPPPEWFNPGDGDYWGCDSNGKSKWDLVQHALKKMLPHYKKTGDFGMILFPDTKGNKPCGVPEVQVGLGQPYGQFVSQLNKVDPEGNAPIGASLLAAYDYFSKQPAEGKARSVVLVADGMDTCGGDPAAAIVKLRSIGVDVFVVAFDTSTGKTALNQWADLGGHPSSGSDAFLSLRRTADLASLLDQIQHGANEETCDGLDNDCDGQVDQGLVRPCSLACGEGFQFCKAGVWGGCVDLAQMTNGVIPDVPPEICDGKDNDCDGLTDEDFDTGGPCLASSGECVRAGVLACSADHKSVVCSAETPKPAPEICDGLDNDCDGLTDEDPGPACAIECGTGYLECKNGVLGPCVIDKPNAEVCDGLDNDCDGKIDEGFAVGAPCKVGEGPCAASGVLVCSADHLETVCDVKGKTVTPQPEICDGLDNDCDGVVDKGPGLCPKGQVCFKGQCVYD